MDSLELCKLNLESLILATAEKYLPQLDLVMTVPGIQSFAAIGIISEIGVDMSVFPTSKHLCSWAGLRRRTTRVPARRKPPESAGPEPTSNRCLFSAPSMRFVPKNSQKSAIATLLSRNAVATRKQSSPLPGCCSPPFTICSRRTSRTTLSSIARATGLPYTVRFCSRGYFYPPETRLSGGRSTYCLDFKHKFDFCPLLGAWVCAPFFGMVLRLQCFNLLPHS